jgi:DHA1 family tetracycline resistance protein-like MFS transporter
VTASSRKRALVFVAAVFAIDMYGIGVVAPVMPELVKSLSGDDIAQNAQTGALLLFTYSIMQFLFAPLIGAISDRFGRRPVILVTLAMLGLDYAVMALAPSLALLFVARALAGIMGATWVVANSCIADLTVPEERGAAFGRLAAAGALGFILGPVIGGLLGEYHIRAPFAVAAALALIGAAAGFKLLPETLPVASRRKFEISRANPIGSLFQIRRMGGIVSLLATIFILQVASQSQFTIWPYFAVLQLGWGPSEIGWTIALFGVLAALAQGVAGPIAFRRFGEARVVGFALVLAVPTYAMLAIADIPPTAILGITLGAAASIALPGLIALATNATAANSQGELQGAIASATSLGQIIGPLLMGFLFEHFAKTNVAPFPGAPFAAAGLLILIAIGIYVAGLRGLREASPREIRSVASNSDELQNVNKTAAP